MARSLGVENEMVRMAFKAGTVEEVALVSSHYKFL